MKHWILEFLVSLVGALVIFVGVCYVSYTYISSSPVSSLPTGLIAAGLMIAWIKWVVGTTHRRRDRA